MAHGAAIGSLTEDLVSRITGVAKYDARFSPLRAAAAKGLKQQNHTRTNQFAIDARLDGLVEKFTVRSREDLAEALQGRRAELPTPPSQWLPEILSFLLEISDRPLEKTRVEDVAELNQPVPPPRELTWDEIIADDPLDEEGIWDDVERGYHSSGDDAAASDELDSEPTVSTLATSAGDEEDLMSLARLHVTQPDLSLLDSMRASREWPEKHTQGGERARLSELDVIRETLSMLHGLPTYLYQFEKTIRRLVPNPSATIDTAATSTLRDILRTCADLGMRLDFLRRWCRTKQKAAFVQAMQAAIEDNLQLFRGKLATVEHRYVRLTHETIVSIIELRSEIESLARPLVHISLVVHRYQASIDSSVAPFALINALYDQACIDHISGDRPAFAVTGGVFFAGLKSYLQLIQFWLEMGALPQAGREYFFLAETDAGRTIGNMWYDRFDIRRLDDGELCAPAFIHTFVNRLFAIGKTQAFTNLLDHGLDTDVSCGGAARNLPNFGDIQTQLSENSLLPFSQLIESTIGEWIDDGALTGGTPSLHHRLFHDHGLRATLKAMQYIYFARDGTLFQTFAEAVFECIRRSGSTEAGARFLLTELAQSTFGAAPHVDADCIAVQLHHDNSAAAGLSGSVMRKLRMIELHFALSWPIQNVLHSASLTAHYAVFALLLQVHYATYLLRPKLFDLRALNSKTEKLSGNLAMSLRLRFRLLWFVNILASHITMTASLLHQTMCSGIEHADGMDEMAAAWAAYSQRLQTALVLAPNLAPIKNAILSILESCEHFALIWQPTPGTSPAGHQSSSNPGENSLEITGADPARLFKDFNKSISFIIAGLRAVSRAGGEATLEVLAERLEWNGG